MKVHAKHIGNVVVATLTGGFDSLDSDGLGESLATIVAANPGNLVLDFESVDYIASYGISLMLKIAQDLRKVQGKFIIAAATPSVMAVLDTVHLGAAIPIVETVDEALAQLNSPMTEAV